MHTPNMIPTEFKVQKFSLHEIAEMDWFDPTGSLLEQLSAIPTHLLETALDLNLQQCDTYELEGRCPGCGTAYVSDAHPAQGANPDYDNAMIWEPNCPNTCPL